MGERKGKERKGGRKGKKGKEPGEGNRAKCTVSKIKKTFTGQGVFFFANSALSGFLGLQGSVPFPPLGWEPASGQLGDRGREKVREMIC